MMPLTPAPLPLREREKGRGGFIGRADKGQLPDRLLKAIPDIIALFFSSKYLRS